ncbi:MAG TPA: hypothetical protein VGK73_36140 [Polyangiaceae bacterium]
MTEPRRWLDDPDAPAELRELLERAPRGRPLDGGTRSRLGRRVARYAVIPLSAATWLSVKSAAALGVAAGVATAGVVAVVERTVLLPERPPAAKAAQRPVPSPAQQPSRVEAPLAPPAASAELVPAPELPRAPVTPAAPVAPAAAEHPEATSGGGLAEETLLLERTRRALATAPALALELTREHTRRFPKAALRAERQLLEIEALYRTGQRDQARALGERLLASGNDDLYAERVRRLLVRIERGQ